MVTCPSYQTKQDLLKLEFSEEILKIFHDPIIEVNKKLTSLNKKEKSDLIKRKYLLSIGRLTKQKNQILLIKTFSKISGENKDLNLIIAGDGEEKIIL